MKMLSIFYPAVQPECEGKAKITDLTKPLICTKKTGYTNWCKAIGLLQNSSVDMAMNFSLPQALAYTRLGNVLI